MHTEANRRYARKLNCMMAFADELAKLGTDPTIQIGCVIFPLDCSRVLAIGYNGAPRGLPHGRPDIPHFTDGGSGMCHAEQNALTKMDTFTAPECLLFVHTTPCMRCAAQIINTGRIIGVIHEDPYVGDGGAGLEYIQHAGIMTTHRYQLNIEVLNTWMSKR